MYTGKYQDIKSSEACRALALNLKKQIQELETRAQYLETKRQKFTSDTHHLFTVQKAAKQLIKEHGFPEEKKWLIKHYCRRFELRSDELAYFVQRQVVRMRFERINNNRVTAIIMWSKGKRKIDIARTLGLTKGRITQIINTHEKLLKQKRYTYSHATLAEKSPKAPFPIVPKRH